MIQLKKLREKTASSIENCNNKKAKVRFGMSKNVLINEYTFLREIKTAYKSFSGEIFKQKVNQNGIDHTAAVQYTWISCSGWYSSELHFQLVMWFVVNL